MAEAELGCLSDVENGVVLVLGTMIGAELLKTEKQGKSFFQPERYPLSARRYGKAGFREYMGETAAAECRL